MEDEMSIGERKAMLEEAAGMIQEAIDQIEQALSGTNLLRRAQAYQIARLKIIACPDHDYLTCDEGIHHLIDDLMEAEREDEQEEYELA